MRTPARPRLQTLGEGEWSPKAARPGVGGDGAEGDGEQMNAISTYPNRLPTSFPGSSLLRTLVAAGHVIWVTNQNRREGCSSTKFCRQYNTYYLGEG